MFYKIDTPAKDLFDRPAIIEPVGHQLLAYSKQKCRYATWISMLIFIISIPIIPGIFLVSCSLFSKPYGTVELLIVFNAFIYIGISPIAIFGGRKRNKFYYFPILIYTLSLFIFLLFPIIGGLDILKMTSTMFYEYQAQGLFLFMECFLCLAIWIYWSAFKSINRYEKYSTTGILLL